MIVWNRLGGFAAVLLLSACGFNAPTSHDVEMAVHVYADDTVGVREFDAGFYRRAVVASVGQCAMNKDGYVCPADFDVGGVKRRAFVQMRPNFPLGWTLMRLDRIEAE